MNEKLEKKITKIVTSSDYRKGKDYFKYYINSRGYKVNPNYIAFNFKVESETTYSYYDTIILKHNSGNITAFCDCEKYRGTKSCKHIAACLYNYLEEIESFDLDSLIKSKTLEILDELLPSSSTGTVKEELQLEISFRSYYNGCQVIIRIGKDKLYVVKNKMGGFLKTYYENKGQVEFGKKFIYEPTKFYFNEKDAQIIDFFYNLFDERGNPYYANATNLMLDDRKLKSLLKLLTDKPFHYEEVGSFPGIVTGVPFEPVILKEESWYCLDFKIPEDSFKSLTSDFEYVAYNNICYHLPRRYSALFAKMLTKGITSLRFEEKDLEVFTKSVLPIIKEEVILDESVSDITIVKKPDVKLYFDINHSSIICNIKLLYKDIEINYFDTNKTILRDVEFENEIVDNLVRIGFSIDKKKFKMSDLDMIGEFFDTNLENLALKYETFTSQKIKDTKIFKNNNITSTFSLGQDNIMSFSFELEGVSNSELDSLLASLKQKKKYFKLKSGDLINLENNLKLNQLENLLDDLEVSSSELKNGNFTIPKYRAIYLDSLKNSKYDIVETDNLFNEFINNFKNYKDKDIKLSPADKKILRDYQITGVKWLYNIHKCDLGGILADEMGLGKSIQVIYFFKKLLEEDQTSKFLIVSPTSLVYNWSNEFDKFAGDIKYEIFAASKIHRRGRLEQTTASVYITSYGLLREDLEYYKKEDFTVCVIDEAQNIKNPVAGITKAVKNVKAKTRIALTGTPIENSLVELWSIYDFVMPGLLANQTNFQSKYKVKEFDDDTNKLLDNLNKQITPFILRRKKVDVLKDLPAKIENNIFINLSDPQKRLYAAEVKKVRKDMDELIKKEGFIKARFMILQLLTKLRQLCIDPRIIFEDYQGESVKIETLIKVVEEAIDNDHKILLFTSFRTALELVRDEFNKKSITSYTIDGTVSSKKRMELVTKFNEDDTNVFLIMLKSGGTGLNLTSADVVIHLDLWWNPQAENQATDRAHRIGQKKTVEVIKLVAKDTIEEKILELQEKKKMLSDKIIEGNVRDKNMLYELSEEDLKNLLANEQD